MLGHQVCYSFPFYHEKKTYHRNKMHNSVKNLAKCNFSLLEKNHTRWCRCGVDLLFCLEFPTDFAYKMIWVKNSLHVRVSDKSSLIFQTWRREESFNEDYRQIAVVTSGRGWCRGGWSLIEHIVTPKGWVLIRDIQLSTDTTFNWENSLVISTEPMH